VESLTEFKVDQIRGIAVVLGKIFGPKRDEVTGGGGWRKLHNEELYDVYSPNIRLIKSM